MDREQTLALLQRGAAGGEAAVHHKITGQAETTELDIPVSDMETLDPDKKSSVTVELEMAHNNNYSHITARAWISSPCHVGEEAQQQKRLMQILRNSLEDYHDNVAQEILQRWAGQR